MTIIVIAGGTGGVGRTLVDAFENDGKHTIVVLSRKGGLELKSGTRLTMVKVEYTSIASLIDILRAYNIEAVISTLNTFGDNQNELNLISAAEQCSSVKRFVPSVFGIPYRTHHLESYPPAKSNVRAIKTLSETRLEWTAFYIGYFLDYYLMPKVSSHLKPCPFLVDVENNEAAIPDSGDTPVTFTHSKDVAKMVVASFDLPTWKRETYATGDSISYNNLIKVIEDVKGEKMKVTYDSVGKLREGQVTELPGYQQLYGHIPKPSMDGLISMFALLVAEGDLNLSAKTSLSTQYPHVQVTSLRTWLERAWSE